MKNILIALGGMSVGIGGFFGVKKLVEQRQAKNDLAVAHLHAEMAKVTPKG